MAAARFGAIGPLGAGQRSLLSWPRATPDSAVNGGSGVADIVADGCSMSRRAAPDKRVMTGARYNGDVTTRLPVSRREVSHGSRPACGTRRSRLRPCRWSSRVRVGAVCRACGRRVLARLEPRRVRDPDGRRLGVGRVRRDREPGGRAGRPGRTRGRVRDVVRLDRHAQGNVGGVHARAAGPSRADRERGRDLRARRRSRRMRAGSPRPVARSRCASSAARPSMGWAGATRRTPSSKVPQPRRRRRARAWSGCQVADPATPSTRT